MAGQAAAGCHPWPAARAASPSASRPCGPPGVASRGSRGSSRTAGKSAGRLGAAHRQLVADQRRGLGRGGWLAPGPGPAEVCTALVRNTSTVCGWPFTAPARGAARWFPAPPGPVAGGDISQPDVVQDPGGQLAWRTLWDRLPAGQLLDGRQVSRTYISAPGLRLGVGGLLGAVRPPAAWPASARACASRSFLPALLLWPPITGRRRCRGSRASAW